MEVRVSLGKKGTAPPPSSQFVKSHKEGELWAQSFCCAPQPKAFDGASASRNILERMLLFLSQ